MVLGDLEGVLLVEEIGRVQHRRVQHMALDPFAAIDQPPEVAKRPGHPDAEGILHRL